MAESYFEREHKKHVEELCRRIRSCTYDEILAIAETICDIDCDILLTVLHDKMKGEKHGS